MKNIIKLSLLSTIAFSFNCFATISELNLITLKSDEVVSPARDVDTVTADSIQLFDGRIINNSEIKSIEINDSYGNPRILPSGRFKIISVDSARVGGDATGGG
jgi:hypothetical protein